MGQTGGIGKMLVLPFYSTGWVDGMNRGTRKAIQKRAKRVPLADRPLFYNMVCGENLRWPLTAGERKRSAEIVAQLDPDTPFFHGGLAGRVMGNYLLPASETGHDPKNLKEHFPTRASLVYLTTSIDEAGIYAIQTGGKPGAIYLVEPEGPLELDVETFRPLELMLADRDLVRRYGRATLISSATAFACPRAKVLGIVQEFSAAFCVNAVKEARKHALDQVTRFERLGA
ncbi:NAD(+)--rifampin ADP-ribosyltransferase [Antarcticimicrobium luteum]|uniref:Rifampin ADP-ribosyltransferase domain-containing protein n=1 Tax=Antarcticimicrobium luteum TaxID=2547397 RepID=A0A4R5VBI9_9RHOB|nr:NAD(+)--rifampin ADP-ribosyltransferase [Antarcticimicrobium luteum]TDK49648.1 hypothetical protein E1832_08615 [Antarcticimicrobium luteum]